MTTVLSIADSIRTVSRTMKHCNGYDDLISLSLWWVGRHVSWERGEAWGHHYIVVGSQRGGTYSREQQGSGSTYLVFAVSATKESILLTKCTALSARLAAVKVTHIIYRGWTTPHQKSLSGTR